MKITWENIINCRHNWHGSRDYFYKNIVVPSGYPFFLWNDKVYKVDNEVWYAETGFTIDDIK